MIMILEVVIDKKFFCRIVNVADLVDHRMKIKKNEMRDKC